MSFEVTVDDVYTALDGDVTDRTEKFIQSKIEEALAILAGVCPRLRAIISGEKEPDKLMAVRIRAVVVAAVMRVIKDDRSGYTHEKESAYEITIDRIAQSPDIWFTDKDLEKLGCKDRPNTVGTAKLGVSGMFTATTQNWWYCN